jgi:ribosomal protein L2
MSVLGLFIPFAFFCGFYILAIVADLVSTKIAINKGLREGNPILGKKNPILVSAIISLATVIFAIVAANIEATTAHAALFCLIAGVYRTVLTVLNTIKIKNFKPNAP